MSKKIIIWILGAAIAAALLFFLFDISDVFTDSKSFAVKDVSRVSRITIERDSSSIVLEKRDGHWIVNSKGEAKPMMMHQLLFFIENVEVRAPIPRGAKAEAQKALDAGYYITVEDSSTVLSQFTIAEIPNSNLGTIGMVEGKSSIYQLYIPGTSFSMASCISVDAQQWNQKLLLTLSAPDIVSINVENIAKPSRSFKIFRGTDGKFHLLDSYREVEVPDYSDEQLQFYLSFYLDLDYQELLSMSEIELKSLVLSQPEAIVSIVTTNGSKESLKLFLKPTSDEYDEVGRPLNYDRDKLYVVYNNDSQVALASWIDYDLLLKDVNFFLITN